MKRKNSHGAELSIHFNVYEALYIVYMYWRNYAFKKHYHQDFDLMILNLSPDERLITFDPGCWYEWQHEVAKIKGLLTSEERLNATYKAVDHIDWNSITVDAAEIYQAMTAFFIEMLWRYGFDSFAQPLKDLSLNPHGITTDKKQWRNWMKCVKFVAENERHPLPDK